MRSQSFQGGLQITFRIDEKVAVDHDAFAILQTAHDFDVAIAFAAKLDVARLEPAVASIEDDDLARAAVDDGAFRDGDNGLLGAGGNVHIGIHVRQQREVRIGQLDAHAHRARFFHQVWIDDGHLAGEDATRMGARRHLDRLGRV